MDVPTAVLSKHVYIISWHMHVCMRQEHDHAYVCVCDYEYAGHDGHTTLQTMGTSTHELTARVVANCDARNSDARQRHWESLA